MSPVSNKSKTVSFRIGEAKFSELKDVADDRELSLSSVFREYVDTFVGHDGQVEVVPKHALRANDSPSDDQSAAFPITVTVPKSFVREHERLEMEREHLEEQLEEYKQYATHLETQLEAQDAETEGHVRLEEVDFEAGTSSILVE